MKMLPLLAFGVLMAHAISAEDLMASNPGPPPRCYFDVNVQAAEVEVPRLNPRRRRARKMVREFTPVVLLGLGVLESVQHWTVDYIAAHAKHKTFSKQLKREQYIRMGAIACDSHRCVYTDRNKVFEMEAELEQRRQGAEASTPVFDFNLTTDDILMSLPDAVDLLRQQDRDTKFYIQNNVLAFGGKLEEDMTAMRWERVMGLDPRQFENNETSGKYLDGSFWFGDEGILTPMHFDMTPTVLSVAHGAKCVLVVPNTDENFKILRPHPLLHPNARQSMLAMDLWDIQHQAFNLSKLPPGLRGARVARVGVGESLYLPPGHWHEVANVDDGDSDEDDGAADFVMSFGFTPRDQRNADFSLACPRVSAALECEEAHYNALGGLASVKQMVLAHKAPDAPLPAEGNRENKKKKKKKKKKEKKKKKQSAVLRKMQETRVKMAREKLERLCAGRITPLLHTRQGETLQDFFGTYFQGRFGGNMRMIMDARQPGWRQHIQTVEEYDAAKDQQLAHDALYRLPKLDTPHNVVSGSPAGRHEL